MPHAPTTATQAIEDIVPKLKQQGYFLTEEDVAVFAEHQPAKQLLIRCGNGRLVTSAMYVAHFVKVVNESGIDHVRDVALLAGDPLIE